ncbi:MAG: hypothetical protein Q4G34_09305, partial [Micrococcus sp.]|nr:hypothetical protein [Micrococcus sp.]
MFTRKSQRDLPFEVDFFERPELIRARQGAAVTLAMHLFTNAPLLSLDRRRLVLYGEFPLTERILGGSIGQGRWARLRTSLSWRWRGVALRRMIKESGGFQSNGYPAYHAYGDTSPNAMLYFDSRVTKDIVATVPRSFETRGPADTVRLGFS